MNRPPPRIAYLTAGAAGMYCGSCLRDNTLVLALQRQGVDAALIPTYTPIRTDEVDASIDQVFLGGINVYLQQKYAFFRHIPAFLDRWLSRPGLIRWVTRDTTAPGVQALGEMTLSMLRGEHGHQAKEVERLVNWLRDDFRPQLINLTNVLIAGCVPRLRRELDVPIVVTLQGDDLFLEFLSEPHRRQAIELIQRIVRNVDAFIVFTKSYADAMREYLGIPAERLHVVPLGIQAEDFSAGAIAHAARVTEAAACSATSLNGARRSIGYLARLAPEKGLHQLVEAFLLLRQQPSMQDVQLRIAGWLGPQHQAYAQEQFQRLKQAGLGSDFHYAGPVDRAGKVAFLSAVDLFSVPTTYPDPKGLYVLEALASGVAVVQPDLGAFPELLASTQGGRLSPPNDPQQLARVWQELLEDAPLRRQLGQQGRAAVMERHTSDVMAAATWRLYRELLE
jgi:glycosyltransferase involved in cell wall biosynthesis